MRRQRIEEKKKTKQFDKKKTLTLKPSILFIETFEWLMSPTPNTIRVNAIYIHMYINAQRSGLTNV